MDTRLHRLNAQLTITPRWHNDPPKIIVSFANEIYYAGYLYETTTFTIDKKLPNGDYRLSVEFINKQDSDTDLIHNLDKAVIIDSIKFNNISSDRFVWAGIYSPNYPEPWATEQRLLGNIIDPHLKHHTYLGWNGKWALTFSMPIFTWIHKTEDLGWIYI